MKSMILHHKQIPERWIMQENYKDLLQNAMQDPIVLSYAIVSKDIFKKRSTSVSIEELEIEKNLQTSPTEPRFISYINPYKKINENSPKKLKLMRDYCFNIKNKQGYQYITPRSLLAVIRLSQALAKLRMNDKVKQEDVDEALRLVEVSQSSINKKDNKEGLATFDGVGKKMDAKSQIYNIVSELCKSDKNKTVKIDVIKKKIRLRNFTDKQLENMLQEYVN